MDPHPEELDADDDDHRDDAHFGEEEDEVAHAVDGGHAQSVGGDDHEGFARRLAEAVAIDRCNTDTPSVIHSRELLHHRHTDLFTEKTQTH